MPGCLRSCVGRGVLLLLLVGGAVAAWVWGPELYPALARLLEGDRAEPTPELAERTLDRLEEFRSGESGDRMSLGGVEIASVLRYALPGLVPSGVTEPRVRIDDGRIRLEARAAREAFPRMPDLGAVVGMLPDTVSIALEATLVPGRGKRSHLVVHSVEVARIPVPERLIPPILTALGREDRPGLPDDALFVPLPSGLASIHLDGDSLVLIADPSGDGG